MELIVLRNGDETRMEVEERGHLWWVKIGDRTFEVDSATTNGSVRSLLIGGRQFEVSVHRKGPGQFSVRHLGSIDEVEVLDPLTYLAEKGSSRRKKSGPQQVKAYMPGRVVEVLVQEGDAVETGQGLVILEAMKMENEIQAEHPAVVARVFVAPGQAVEGGDPLFELE
jgi:biotin carboxyl carrier protein